MLTETEQLRKECRDKEASVATFRKGTAKEGGRQPDGKGTLAGCSRGEGYRGEGRVGVVDSSVTLDPGHRELVRRHRC